jgi:hypothetical protein
VPDQHPNEPRIFPREQELSAEQALRSLRSRDDVAQGLGEKLGKRQILLGCLQTEKGGADSVTPLLQGRR